MAFGSNVLSNTASFDPFWWRAAPHEERHPSVPPKRTDVAIVGSGITPGARRAAGDGIRGEGAGPWRIDPQRGLCGPHAEAFLRRDHGA